MSHRIALIGAGSVGFSVAVARELIQSEVLKESTFVLMDIDQQGLDDSEGRIKAMAGQAGGTLNVEATLDRRKALEGADFVVTAYTPHRTEFWIKDIEIAMRHGVDLLQGENGGPAGQIHALRNITILAGIASDVEALCPGAWIMNFTNPMSMLCTYLHKHTKINSLGFCHQVFGSFGVIAEMLGMEPGDLQVITAGINHMSFLLDIRKKGCAESYMEKFLRQVRSSPYWQKNQEYVPEQVFTLEFLNAFGIYPVGYDNHIGEYMPFFYGPQEWKKLDYRLPLEALKKLRDQPVKKSATGTVDDVEVERILGKGLFPFPKDPTGPWYREKPVAVMESLLTGEPLYLDSIVLTNEGCVPNLPADAAVFIPALVIGGKVRGVAVGELPFFAAELCRRQIAIHELIVEAAVTGERRLFLEALCLDPFVHSLATARNLMDDYLGEYKQYVPQLHR